MPAFNFQARFADLVSRGIKRQTIRANARGAAPGKTAYLYTGQRTRSCRKLGEHEITQVFDIAIGREESGRPYAVVDISGGFSLHLIHDGLDKLAIKDGFTSGEEMVAWFEQQHGLPFQGSLISWSPDPL